MDMASSEPPSTPPRQITDEDLINELHGLTLTTESAVKSVPDDTNSQPQVTPDDPTTLHSFEDKRKVIQQQLVLLIHAHKCQQRLTSGQCTLPHCRIMKNVLQHLDICTAGPSCTVTHCSSSRQIIAHWKICQNEACPVCTPVNCIGGGGGPTNSPEPLKNDGHVNIPMPSSSSSMMAENSAADVVKNLLTELHLYEAGRAALESLEGEAKGPSQNSKDWQAEVSPELRHHLVRKVIQSIFPSPDSAAMADPRMLTLVAYAEKVEKEKFEAAGSRSEYYHSVADKIYSIQRELNEKRQKRQEQVLAQQLKN